MTTPSSDRATLPRTMRIDPELWFPFQELCRQVAKTNASTQLRRWISDWLEEYRVFWAEDPVTPGKWVAWYECESCDTSHRLSGDNAPWGCSVTKSYSDRRELKGLTES